MMLIQDSLFVSEPNRLGSRSESKLIKGLILIPCSIYCHYAKIVRKHIQYLFYKY